MDKYVEFFKECVRFAIQDDQISDLITTELDGDYEGLSRRFREIFGEDLWSGEFQFLDKAFNLSILDF